uniref:Uncharacterized protein n=1 Tax=Moniliophthora roreri TaxID=221103 RepID=A0A0W0F5L3_MONRR
MAPTPPPLAAPPPPLSRQPPCQPPSQSSTQAHGEVITELKRFLAGGGFENDKPRGPRVQSKTREKYGRLGTTEFFRPEKDLCTPHTHRLQHHSVDNESDEGHGPVELGPVNPMSMTEAAADTRATSTSGGATGSSADATAIITPGNKPSSVGMAAPPPAPTTPLQQMSSTMEELRDVPTEKRTGAEGRKKPVGRGRAWEHDFAERQKDRAKSQRRKCRPQNPFIDDEAAVDNYGDDSDDEEKEGEEEEEDLDMAINEDKPLFLQELQGEDEEMQQVANTLEEGNGGDKDSEWSTEDNTLTPLPRLNKSSRKQGPSKPVLVEITDSKDSDDMYTPFPKLDSVPLQSLSMVLITVETVSDDGDPFKALPRTPWSVRRLCENIERGSFGLKGKGKAPARPSSPHSPGDTASNSATASGSRSSCATDGNKPAGSSGGSSKPTGDGGDNGGGDSDGDDNYNGKPSGLKSKRKKKPGFLQVTKAMRKKWGLGDASTTGTNLALITHIRILARFFKEDVIPHPPMSALVSAFEEKFKGDNIYEGLSRPVPQQDLTEIREHIDKLRSEGCSKSTSTHLCNIANVADDKLFNSLVTVISFGLTQWWPDYTGNYNTPYNNAHHSITLLTFQSAVRHHAYNHLQPIQSQATNIDLLVRMYDHYPGELKKRLGLTNTYKRRKNLQEDQFSYLKYQGFSDQVCNLFCDPQSVSEDKWDSVQQCYLIKSKPECSKSVTAFAREINKRNWQNKSFRPGAKKPHKCKEPAEPIDPVIPSISSSKTTINYFDTDWFNQQDSELQKEYLERVPTVALPERWDVFFGNAEEATRWRKMPLHDFMIWKGNNIWKKYMLPSTEELKNMVGCGSDEENAPELTEEQQKQAMLLKKLRDRGKGEKGKGKRRANVDEGYDEDKDKDQKHAGLSKLKKPCSQNPHGEKMDVDNE